MYLEVVDPWNESLEDKYTCTSVGLEALTFLTTIGASLTVTVVELDNDEPNGN